MLKILFYRGTWQRGEYGKGYYGNLYLTLESEKLYFTVIDNKAIKVVKFLKNDTLSLSKKKFAVLV